MTKVLTQAQEARNQMVSGINKLAQLVCNTMGPSGQTIIIEEQGQNGQSFGKATRDGVSVAASVDFKNKLESIGAGLAKQVAINTVRKTGDGTTGSISIFNSLATNGAKLVNQGLNPNIIKSELIQAKDLILLSLQGLSQQISSPQQLYHVAMVATNQDNDLATLVSTAFASIGENGSITIQDAPHGSAETTLKLASGFELKSGYVAKQFVNDLYSQKVLLDYPLIWIINSEIYSRDHLNDAMVVLEYAHKSKRPLVIVANSVDEEVLATLILNNQKKTIPCVAIKAGGYGKLNSGSLDDLADFVGATVRDETLGPDFLKDINPEEFGTCRRIEVSEHKSIFILDEEKKADLAKKIEILKAQLADPDTDPVAKHMIGRRLAVLDGGVAVISVGGESEISQIERKMRLEDAIGSVQAAKLSGILPGGGAALIKARTALVDLAIPNTGFRLLYDACEAPFQSIVANEGHMDGHQIHKTIDLIQSDSGDLGYDAFRHDLGQMIDSGIIDASLTIQSALINAVSVAGMFLTTGGTITNE